MELNDYLRLLRAHWIGVALLAASGLLAAAAYNLTQPEVYAANATGFVQTGDSRDPGLASINDNLAKSRAKSYIDIAKGRATAQGVIQDLERGDDPAALIGHITVEQPADTVLLKITARDGTPREAQQLADAWVAALAKQVQEIENPGRVNPSGLKVVPVEAAALPSAPISPRTRLNLLLGLLLGALLGLAYAIVRNQLDRRIRSADAVEKDFGVPVVGAVPLTDGLAHKPGERAPIAVRVLAQTAPSGEGEAFRKLRTNLAYMDVDNPPRVIVVTSPNEGDGKSTVAVNIAAAMAASGQMVVLVDGDLRRPTLADSFGIAEGVGLTDLLIGRVTTEEALQVVSTVPNLKVLAAGRIPPNPSELLGTQAMVGLLGELAKDAMVIIDAPPLLPVTDAAVLTARADGALVVISVGRTLDSELGTALGHLAAVSGRALGVVFNRAVRNSGAGYYGAAYYQVEHPANAGKTQ